MSRHDQFAGQNAANARSWEMEKRDKDRKKKAATPAKPLIGICDSCKKEKVVKSFRINETQRTEGSTSFGIVTKLLCSECQPQAREVKELKPKEIKNLLKKARKGLR